MERFFVIAFFALFGFILMLPIMEYIESSADLAKIIAAYLVPHFALAYLMVALRFNIFRWALFAFVALALFPRLVAYEEANNLIVFACDYNPGLRCEVLATELKALMFYALHPALFLGIVAGAFGSIESKRVAPQEF